MKPLTSGLATCRLQTLQNQRMQPSRVRPADPRRSSADPGPPRCSPAWSRVRNQNVGPRGTPRHRPARPGGAVFNTARLVAPLGIPRPSAMNIAPRWQAAWWRGRSIRRDASLVLNTARRRQAPPWHPTHRSPDPSVGLTVGLRPRLSATAFSVRQKKLTDLLARPSHPDDGSACPECPAAKSTAKNDCRRLRRAVR
jgi:hypothetical protein